ncbi:MAG TPA: helix-turn-helix domain-containing protein [Candidatus Baltobacteraceae bacterium]|nr:helix-turn-helix domain-containing protein [Candidatus Baltobacteraceae bacterium]
MLHEIPARSPEETRSRILAATRQLFAKKGRRGTTTREIAELAGVNEATLFRHFGNKDALIEACAEHYCAATAFQELLPKLSGKLQEDLRVIAGTLFQRLEEVRDMIVMSLSEEENDSTVGLAAWRGPQAVRSLLVDYMARRVESGELTGDPQLLARFFMGMIFAQVVGRKKLPELQYTMDQILDFQVNVFLNGVRK